MQCRICFEDGDAGTLVSPCLCRGTSSHIHQTCLDRYIQYYPDRICRVCHSLLEHSLSANERTTCLGIVIVLIALLFMSNARLLIKLVLLGTTVAMTVWFVRRGLFSLTPATFVAILILLFLPGGDPTAVYLWLGTLGCIAILYTLTRQLPAQVFLGLVLIMMLSAYVGFLTILAYHTLDAPAFTLLLGLLYLGWYGWLHDTPRLRLA